MSFVRSPGYGRFKLINAALFGLMGVFIIAQMIHGIGLHVAAIPGIVLGGCLVGLAVVRFRDAMRGPRT